MSTYPQGFVHLNIDDGGLNGPFLADLRIDSGALRMTSYKLAIPFMLAVVAGGCAGSASSLTTGSLFGGGSSEPAKAEALAAPAGDATSRAFQVGSVSARAVKCGYNFDAPALKAKFLATEASQGATPELISRADKIYDVAYNGVWKGVAAQKGYCSAKRTQQIQSDLRRHLAGDYATSSKKVVKAAPSSSGFTSWFTAQPY